MEEELNRKIEAAVVEILRESDMSATSEYMVRSMASKRLGLDLSSSVRKLFVRGIVESFLASQQTEDEETVEDFPASSPVEEEEEEESAEQPEADREEEAEEGGCSTTRNRRPEEYDDEGVLILGRLSNKRRMTLQDFKGKTQVSIREYSMKDGKELPSSKDFEMANQSIVLRGYSVLHIEGETFTPDGRGVSSYISGNFKKRLCAAGITWRRVDQETRDFYYQEFVKKYTWEEGHEKLFKSTFLKYCEKRYKDLIYEIRKKGRKPMYVDPPIWDAWTATWAEEKWKANAEKARANRHTDTQARHTSGSKSIVEHAMDLERTLQRQPTCLEVFLKTHKKKDGSFVDSRSRSIHENITNRMTEASQPAVEGGDPQPLDTQAINDMYYEAVGGRTKDSTLYGLGSQAKVSFDRLRTPRGRDSSASSSSFSQVDILIRENQELRKSMENQQKYMEEQQKNMEAQQKKNDELFAYIQKVVVGFTPSQTQHGFESQETQDPQDPGCS